MGKQKIQREDLQCLHEKYGMPPKQYEGPASFALTKEEKEIFFECLLSMKALSGFSSNIKGTSGVTRAFARLDFTKDVSILI